MTESISVISNSIFGIVKIPQSHEISSSWPGEGCDICQHCMLFRKLVFDKTTNSVDKPNKWNRILEGEEETDFEH